MLDEAGLSARRSSRAAGLDEHEVAELVHAGAPVDAFGVGTQLGVSADAPYLDTVYKLVEYDGRPAMKLSAAKASPPGRKQVWRGTRWRRATCSGSGRGGPAGWEPMLEPVMTGGQRLAPDPPFAELCANGSRLTSRRSRRRRAPRPSRARGGPPLRGARVTSP